MALIPFGGRFAALVSAFHLRRKDMGKLFLFNFILIAMIVIGLWQVKKHVKKESAKKGILLFASLLTILFHYSLAGLKLFAGEDFVAYMGENPNLLLPIYPCNVVMWSALVFALLKNKTSRVGAFFADYLFWFGIVSTLVGMFANVDFIRNPTLADYENVKSIGAHATLLFNVLLLPLFGYIKTDVKRNITNIVISVFGMAVIGGYCNLVLGALASPETAYDQNAMFLIHSPFDGLDFLVYPVIALIAIPIYLLVFVLCDFVAHKKGRRLCDEVRKSEQE